MSPNACRELIEVLERYFAAVASQKTDHPVDLLAVFTEVDRVEARHAGAMPPILRHYFEGKSYRKAYAFLLQEVGAS